MCKPSGIDLWRSERPRDAASCRCRWQSGMMSPYRSPASSLHTHITNVNTEISADARSLCPRLLAEATSPSSENNSWQHFPKYNLSVSVGPNAVFLTVNRSSHHLLSFHCQLVSLVKHNVWLAQRLEPLEMTKMSMNLFHTHFSQKWSNL